MIETTFIRPHVSKLACPLFLTALTALSLQARAQDGPVSSLFTQPVLAAEVFAADGNAAIPSGGAELVSERLLVDWGDREASQQARIRLAAAERASDSPPTAPLATRPSATSGVKRADSKSNTPPQAVGLWYTQPDAPEPLDLSGLVLRLVLGTSAVLAACVGSLWAARRWLKHGSAAGSASGRIELIETMPLANRCSVQLIQVDSRRLLVGMDASGLKTILPLADPFANTFDAVSDNGPNSAAPTDSFPEALIASRER